MCGCPRHSSAVSELSHAQLSVMPGLPVRSGMTAWQFASADADWAGTLMTGGAVSLTVTVCVHDSVPELFDAVHVTLVTPDGKAALSGLPSLRELVTVTLSPVVVGVPSVTAAWQFASASTVTFAGQEMVTGEPEEVTVTRKSQVVPSDAL